MPQRGALEECGPEDTDGQVRDRIQTNGRCEAAIERGDTYGPVSYLAYVPATSIFGWSGKWDSLPAAHATSIAFDVFTILGLALVGMRFGGRRLAALLVFAWAAYPFTAYTLNANTNDAIMPAFLVLGFWLASSAWARGAAVALAGWAKFGALLVAPLWATYPSIDLRRLVRFALSFVGATLVAFSLLLLEPDLWKAARTFWDRTLGFQVGRDSRSRSGDGGSTTLKGSPTSGSFSRCSWCSLWRSPRRRRPTAAEGPCRARSPHRCAAHRLPAHADALVLPLPTLGAPVRAAVAPAPEVRGSGNGTRSASIDEALPVSALHSTSAPSMRTSP